MTYTIQDMKRDSHNALKSRYVRIRRIVTSQVFHDAAFLAVIVMLFIIGVTIALI